MVLCQLMPPKFSSSGHKNSYLSEMPDHPKCALSMFACNVFLSRGGSSIIVVAGSVTPAAQSSIFSTSSQRKKTCKDFPLEVYFMCSISPPQLLGFWKWISSWSCRSSSSSKSSMPSNRMVCFGEPQKVWNESPTSALYYRAVTTTGATITQQLRRHQQRAFPGLTKLLGLWTQHRVNTYFSILWIKEGR